MLKKRDNELNQLLNSVNDLAGIFKDMQVLVMEQGSILDRIDYNIDIASTNITSGKKRYACFSKKSDISLLSIGLR